MKWILVALSLHANSVDTINTNAYIVNVFDTAKECQKQAAVGRARPGWSVVDEDGRAFVCLKVGG